MEAVDRLTTRYIEAGGKGGYQKGWHMFQADVVLAFLNGNLKGSRSISASNS
jgi:hypothetical protein